MKYEKKKTGKLVGSTCAARVPFLFRNVETSVLGERSDTEIS